MRNLRRLVAAGVASVAVLPILAVTPVFALPSGCVLASTTVTCTYSSTGAEQTFTVPAGVTSVDISAVGGEGGEGSTFSSSGPSQGAGGFGASVSVTKAVTPGDVLYVEVGGNGTSNDAADATGGFNGGGSGSAYGGAGSGGGGGASDVRTVSCSSPCDTNDSTSLASRVLIAGGGGGGGTGVSYAGGNGAAGGASVSPGQNGADDPSYVGSGGTGGGGGTQSAGGTGGAGGVTSSSALSGTGGAPGQGGDGTHDGYSQAPGGGGGGGYYGGGGGGSGGRNNDGQIAGGGGGGAGSSYLDASLTDTSVATDTTGTPVITISYSVFFQPDGWIRKNAQGWTGNNVLDTDGTGQMVVAHSVVRGLTLFRIAIQNDGNEVDRFTVQASGDPAPGYRVRYFHKTKDITDSVVSGAYTTIHVLPGSRVTIEAWVRVKPGAAASVTRLITITSVADGSKQDAVGFEVVRR
jgi:hypothetical protein